jgi:hypothetical protein
LTCALISISWIAWCVPQHLLGLASWEGCGHHLEGD